MPVRLLTYEEMTKLVKRTCKREKIELSDDILDELVGSSQGSARTALVLLDKISNLEESQRVEAMQQKLAEDNEAIDLCRLLIKKASWGKIATVLKNLKGEPESTRYAVLGYARSVLLQKPDTQAYMVIECFKEPFYNSKAAGLAGACFESIYGE